MGSGLTGGHYRRILTSLGKDTGVGCFSLVPGVKVNERIVFRQWHVTAYLLSPRNVW